MSTLDDIKAEVQAYDQSRARSQQVETGASGIFGCRAQTLLRLTYVPQSDERLSWQAIVGTAVHSLIEHAAPPEVVVEGRFTYRGVPCTIDRFDPRTRTLTDAKTKDDAAAIDKVRRFGPDDSQKAQVHIGAAALIEAGYQVDTVELLFLPRAGSIDGAYLWSEPFNRGAADDAAAWSTAQDERAADVLARDLDPLTQLDGLRDEPERFCRDYCEWATACRGAERTPVTVNDPFVIAAAQQHAHGKELIDQGNALVAEARPLLEGVSGVAGGLKIGWSGGNVKTGEEIDMAAVLAAHREWLGDPPTRTVEKTTAVSLRVTAVNK